ncbi:MAG: transcription initiation factor IIB [Nitrosopumilus sp.]|uniref:transcription initiation factor IIB n=1 Tax=Nitrosopumilus sp. TaxID=2024843 RepID=UPI00247D331C|nr:transcription initiation factor IIB [Nitrosopumilus sp.]MCV0391937.1 transcription initiation factor IIB [Nitrosopumilus sp.]
MNSNVLLNSNFKFGCPRCGKKEIVTDLNSAEIFCVYCGFVIDEKLKNFGYESFFTDSQKDTRRTGMSRTLSRNDFGLSTVIGSKNKDVHGNSLSFVMSSTIKRIRIQDNRSQLSKYSDTNFKVAFEFLERIQDKLGVSDSVKETAAYIYRKAVEQKITAGRQIYSVIAASMYIACRNTMTLRNLNDVSKAADIKRKNLSQSYRAIVKQLDLKIPLVNQTNYVSKISNTLKISSSTKNLALQILKKAVELDMMAGRDPVGMAAAAVYYSGVIRGDGVSQIQVADASGITSVTVRNRFHELKKVIQIPKNKTTKNTITK